MNILIPKQLHQGRSMVTCAYSMMFCVNPIGLKFPRPKLSNVGSPSLLRAGKWTVATSGADGMSGMYPAGNALV